VAFMPSVGMYPNNCVRIVNAKRNGLLTDTTHTIYYRGHWLRVSLTRLARIDSQ